jgi:glucose-1-phosphate adenylyltransferase
MGPEWFQGTADAVFQNINLIKQQNPELVIVFGADHIYRMDIRRMIDFHIQCDANVTVAARPVPIKEAAALGVIVTDAERRIIEFQEKPKKPTPMPGDPKRAYASMGNYIFRREVLIEALSLAQRKKQHDFGAHILPDLVGSGRLFAYDFATNVIPGVRPYEEAGYWRDVGSIEAFFNAHMDMLGATPAFEINNRLWPILSGGYEAPATKILSGDIKNSLIADGVVIHRARIRNSIIRSNVLIEDGVSVENSIVMDNVVLKKNCRLKRVIVDKHNIVEEGDKIGFDPAKDRFRCHMDVSGIAILPRGGRKLRAQ